MGRQRGFAQILVIILVLIAIGVGVYLVQQKTNLLPLAFLQQQEQTPVAKSTRVPTNRPPKAITPTPVEEIINTTEDLSKALKEVESMDTELINEQVSASEFDTAGL